MNRLTATERHGKLSSYLQEVKRSSEVEETTGDA